MSPRKSRRSPRKIRSGKKNNSSGETGTKKTGAKKPVSAKPRLPRPRTPAPEVRFPNSRFTSPRKRSTSLIENTEDFIDLNVGSPSKFQILN